MRTCINADQCQLSTLNRIARTTGTISALVGASTANNILFRIHLYAMQNYPFIVNIAVTFGYVIFLFPYIALEAFVCRMLARYVWPRLYRRYGAYLPVYDAEAAANELVLINDDLMGRSRANARWYEYMFAAMLDSMSTFIGILGAISTTGPMQLLLSKTDLPMVMIISVVATRIGVDKMRTMYRWTHFVGACLITLGVIVVVAPELSRGGSKNNSVGGIFLFSLSVIPYAFSSVYKERLLKRGLDPKRLNAVIATWQMFISWVFLPLMMVSWGGGLHAREIGPMLTNGVRCLFMGHNTAPDDHCSNALSSGIMTLIVNIITNNLALSATKYGSAAFSLVATSIALPISAIIFGWPLVMGKHAVSFGGVDYMALILVIAGFVVFRIWDDHHVGSDPQPSMIVLSDLPLGDGFRQVVAQTHGDVIAGDTSENDLDLDFSDWGKATYGRNTKKDSRRGSAKNSAKNSPEVSPRAMPDVLEGIRVLPDTLPLVIDQGRSSTSDRIRDLDSEIADILDIKPADKRD